MNRKFIKKSCAVLCVFLLLAGCIVPGGSSTSAAAGSIIDSEGNVDISKIDGASATSWNGVACGIYGYENVWGIYLENGSTFSLGNVDLSLYTEVAFTYASDTEHYDKYNGSGESSAITMKSEATEHPGSSSNCEMNTEALIAKADLHASIITDETGTNWDRCQRVARIDLTDIDYNGPVYLQHYVPESRAEILVVGIKFTKKSSELRGDVNLDKQVDSEDCLKISKALLNPDLYNFNQDMDFNGDGKESSQDAIYLLKHIAQPEIYLLSGGVQSNYKNTVSRDVIKYNDTIVNGETLYKLDTKTSLGDYIGKTLCAYGWYASTEPIIRFGCSVDFGEIDWTVYELETAEDEVKSAAEEAVGDGAYYTRYKISFPVTEGIHVVEFFADDGETGRIWTVNYAAYASFENSEKNVAMCVDSVSSNEGSFSISNLESLNYRVAPADTAYRSFSMVGWAGFTEAISQYGYMIDGEVTFGSFTVSTESAVKTYGGENALRFNITIPVEKLSSGTHTIAAVALLESGTVVRLVSGNNRAELIYVVPETNTAITKSYVVRTAWTSVSSQKGEYDSLSDAKAQADAYGYLGYCVYDSNGSFVYAKYGETAATVLSNAKWVCDFVRENNFTYGNATVNPAVNSSEKLVSCDRLVGWAYYRAGFTDQPTVAGLYVWGGTGNEHDLETWCKKQGFTKVTSVYDLQGGDIVFVNPSSSGYPQHTFICASERLSDGTYYCYDGGSITRIRSTQPSREAISNFMFAYRPN